jgi:hypothetical protein
MFLKVVHIPGKLNMTMDKLSHFKMSGDYCITQRTFQFIQETLRCYPKIDLFASKKNRLLQKFALVRFRQYRNALRIDWRKIHVPVSIYLPIPLILKSIQKFADEGSKATMITPKWKGQTW